MDYLKSYDQLFPSPTKMGTGDKAFPKVFFHETSTLSGSPCVGGELITKRFPRLCKERLEVVITYKLTFETSPIPHNNLYLPEILLDYFNKFIT